MIARCTTPRTLLAIPVYNEEKYVARVLNRVRKYATDILVVDDGSNDSTPMLLAQQAVEVVRHATNRGYGRSMQDAFRWAMCDRFDWLITMDCDEQHEPESIPRFMQAIRDDDADVISGSRYIHLPPIGQSPPADRRTINKAITEELNARLNLSLTDAFCGFKAYRVEALKRLDLDVDGYAFPMQFWVQAVANDLIIREIPVKLIYNDPSRTFGGTLDDPERRLEHYRQTMHVEIVRCADRLPAGAMQGLGGEREPACPQCRCG
jgi:glycosyltransferase involved in cell wall biosynthesis